MSEHMAEPDTRERNPKVEMAWGLLAPYIASDDPPDLSDDDQAEILTAGALPQVWSIILELEQRVEGLEESLDNARNAVSRTDAQIGTLIDQTVIYSGTWDELQEALAGEIDEAE